MRREHLVRKFITDIVVPLEEDLFEAISQKLRQGLQQKPDWTRGEVNDLYIRIMQEVRNERRQVSDS